MTDPAEGNTPTSAGPDQDRTKPTTSPMGAGGTQQTPRE
jgi:hypothetical protein